MSHIITLVEKEPPQPDDCRIGIIGDYSSLIDKIAGQGNYGCAMLV